MTLEEIERALGPDTVRAVEDAVRAAFVQAHCAGDGVAEEAVEELLVAMLAAVISGPADASLARERAEHCSRRLTSIVDVANDPRPDATDNVVELRRTKGR